MLTSAEWRSVSVVTRLRLLLYTTPTCVADGLCMNVGLEAELASAVKLGADQTAELAELKKAAVGMTQRRDALAEELQSSSERLDQAQNQLSDLTANHQSLQQRYDAQAGQCTDLETQLKERSSVFLQLQERLQAETEASTAVQQELEGVSAKESDCKLSTSLISWLFACSNLLLYARQAVSEHCKNC